jgi:two-component system alkaline phosphatase synthesis response regulator PhoP
VLILSARSADRDRIRGLELRADDYLTKPFNLRELLLRVDALLRRRPAPAAGADVLEFGGNRIDFRAMRARTAGGDEVELTATETRLLKLLAAHAGTVVSRKSAVEHLFGSTAPRTVRTLDNVVLRLRKLFEREPGSPRHLHTVRGLGFRFDA